MHAGMQTTVRRIKQLFVVVVTVSLPLACHDYNTALLNTKEAACEQIMERNCKLRDAVCLLLLIILVKNIGLYKNGKICGALSQVGGASYTK